MKVSRSASWRYLRRKTQQTIFDKNCFCIKKNDAKLVKIITKENDVKMRTTLNSQDVTFKVASAYADARAMKLGDAVSELVRRGVESLKEPRATMKKKNGVWVMDVPMPVGRAKPDAALVKALMEEPLP